MPVRRLAIEKNVNCALSGLYGQRHSSSEARKFGKEATVTAHDLALVIKLNRIASECCKSEDEDLLCCGEVCVEAGLVALI